MKFTVTVPAWVREGDAAAVALVAAWVKEIGDRVEAGETLAVLRTLEGGEIAVVSPAFGIVARKFVLAGEAIEAGEPLATLSGVPASVLAGGERPVPDGFGEAPSYVPGGPEDAVVWSPGERRYVQTLARARQVAPHVVTVAEVDVTEAVRLAQKSGAIDQGGDADAAFLLPFLVSAAAAALLRFPGLNAQLIAPGEVRRKRYVRVAFPVYDTNGGGDSRLLALPVLVNANRKSVLALVREIADLSARARGGSDIAPLSPDEQTGATFTVSPCGGDILYQTPTIHLPQSAHLAFGPPLRVPAVADDGAIAARWRVHLCLSHDARLASDRDAARFVSEIKAHLEEARFLFA